MNFKVDTLKKPISYYKEFNRFNINIDNINDIKIVRSDETIEIRILSNINNNTNNVWEMVQPYQSGAMMYNSITKYLLYRGNFTYYTD